MTNYIFMTPKADRRFIALPKNGCWVEIYRGEVLLCHPHHRFVLEGYGFVECDKPQVFKTPEEALELGAKLGIQRFST